MVAHNYKGVRLGVKAVGAAFPVGRARKQLDPKGRLQLPAHQAAALGNTVYVCPGHDSFLEIYGEAGWRQYQAKLILAAERGPRRFRNLLRHILGSATPAKIDPQARLVIPKDILAWAQLSVPTERDSQEVMVVGVGECVEVWNPALFESTMKQVPAALGDLWDEMRHEYVEAGTDLSDDAVLPQPTEDDEPE